uniref:Uncharacterized protein n=1 Tax=Anopheles christyi TaxID=43041 RepID=A0A182KI38_9DIPT
MPLWVVPIVRFVLHGRNGGCRGSGTACSRCCITIVTLVNLYMPSDTLRRIVGVKEGNLLLINRKEIRNLRHQHIERDHMRGKSADWMDGKIFAHPAHRIRVELFRLICIVRLVGQIRFAVKKAHRNILMHVTVERCRVAGHKEQNLGRVVKLITILLCGGGQVRHHIQRTALMNQSGVTGHQTIHRYN